MSEQSGLEPILSTTTTAPDNLITFPTKRLTVAGAEDLLGVELPVGSQGGFIRLVDYSGGDARICQAARVSYGGGTKTVREDAALIAYLVENQHMSPLEMPNITTHWRLPIVIARQVIRHRTAKVNEMSGRYSVMPDQAYLPGLDELRFQGTTNKQGSGDRLPLDAATRLHVSMAVEQRLVQTNYHHYLEMGLSREVARMNLPLSTMTEWYWQMDLRNLLHFIGLRADGHAQPQVRVYAEALIRIVKAWCPETWQAYENHVLRGVRFSAEEWDVLKRLVGTHVLDDRINQALPVGWSERKRLAFRRKLTAETHAR